MVRVDEGPDELGWLLYELEGEVLDDRTPSFFPASMEQNRGKLDGGVRKTLLPLSSRLGEVSRPQLFDIGDNIANS